MCCQVAVPRNDPGVGGDLLYEGARRIGVPSHGTARSQVDVRKAAVEKEVAHVNDVRFGEEYNAVPIGVGFREMHHP